MEKLTLKERNVLICLLRKFEDDVNNYDYFKWTRGFIGIHFDDEITNLKEDKQYLFSFSYKHHQNLINKLFGDSND